MPRLKFSTYSNAVIAPFERDANGVGRAGVVANQKVIRESLGWRSKLVIGPVENPFLASALAQTGPADRVIYAGLVSSNFGHFLLESLARLWICRLLPGIPLAWIGATHFNRWQSEILDILGVGGPHLFIQFPERFNCVILPQVGYRIHDFFAHWHRDFLGAVKPAKRVKGRRAWVSRSGLSNVGHVLGEKDIEVLLAAEGWEIYHPQEHRVIEQLRYLSSCEDIAGWEGSAFHSLVLLKTLKTVVHIFPRGLQVNQNYWTIANTKGFVQYVYPLPLSLIRGKGSKTVWELEDTGRIKDILLEVTRRSQLTFGIKRLSRRIETSFLSFAAPVTDSRRQL